MIIRIVRMYFEPENVDVFLEIFAKSQPAIRAMPGCSYLELWRDVDEPHVFVTYSHWESVEALNNYRNSEFFGKVWKETKILFSGKPVAFSVEKVI